MSKEAMKLALEALEAHADIGIKSDKAITALREALAEQPAQQEPVREMPSNTRHAEGQALTYWDNLPEISAWAERHDINGTPLSLRCMVEDAASLHLTTTPQAQPAQQCKWPICQSEEYQQVLAEQIKRELVGEQPAQQEPYGWHTEDHLTDRSATTYSKDVADRWKSKGWPVTPLYTSPPAQRTWVGLTDVEWMNIVNKDQAWFGQRPDEVAHEVAKLVEAKLKEKNT